MTKKFEFGKPTKSNYFLWNPLVKKFNEKGQGFLILIIIYPLIFFVQTRKNIKSHGHDLVFIAIKQSARHFKKYKFKNLT